MAGFSVDMRGLNEGQRQFASDRLLESNNYLTVREVQNDFITIELSDAQKVVSILLHGTDIRQNLADMMNSKCQQRSDLFMPNSNYAWWTRILPRS
jgi:hypothetical protein